MLFKIGDFLITGTERCSQALVQLQKSTQSVLRKANLLRPGGMFPSEIVRFIFL